MMKWKTSLGLSLALFCAVVQTGIAQAPDIASEERMILAGEIIEILPLTTISSPNYGWILLKDAVAGQPEQFLQGGTDAIFRYRPIEPGRYTLFGDISASEGSVHLQRTFHFEVRPREADASSSIPAYPGSGASLVTTNPALQPDGTVSLSKDSQLVQLLPLDASVRPLSIDSNAERDTNGNGNPSDDADAADSFFVTSATPLYLWLADSAENAHMVVIRGGDSTQTIHVASFEYAKVHNMLASTVKIAAEKGTGSTLKFSAILDEGFPAESAILYQWSFGDGQESLETRPEHTFTEGQMYTVTVRITYLANGREIGQGAAQVMIPPSTATASASSAGASSAPSSDGESSGGFLPFGLSLWSIFIGLVILLVSVGLGLGLIFLLSRLRKGSSLEGHLARMEENIMKKEQGKAVTSAAAAPLAIPTVVIPSAPPTPVASEAKPKTTDEGASETQKKLAEKEKEAAKEPAIPSEPVINTEKAPDWLKKGLKGETVTASATPVPPVTPVPSVPKPNPTPAPPPAPAPTPAPAPSPAPKPIVTPPAPPAPKPETSTPPASPAAPSAPVVAATSVAATPPADAVVPDWLKAAQTMPASAVETPKPVIPQEELPDWLKPAPVSTPEPVIPAATSVPPAPTPTPAPAPKPATPPGPQEAPKPTPAPPVTPVPPTPSSPTPAPQQPKPAPQQQPRPNNPQNPPRQQQQRQPRPQQPRDNQQNQQRQVQQPKPTPAPAPAPAPQPKPAMSFANDMASTPVPPVTPVTPVPPQAPITPATPIPEEKPAVEEPIAFIRAESLNPPNNEPPKA